MVEITPVEITTAEVKDYLAQIQGKETSLSKMRKELNILPGTKSFDSIRVIMFQLAMQKIVRPSGKHDGVYKVVTQVSPVQVYGIERKDRPPFNLAFPRDFDTMMELNFAEDVVIREGDLITIGGVKSSGKSTLCLNFAGENIDKHPILMGNEYTILTEDKYDIAPRFKSRFDTMSITNVESGGWVNWVDTDGKDKFTLLPVWEDYAEHIVKNKINIIDWVDLPGEYYMISPLMRDIKKALGREGIGIIALQKSENKPNPRGDQMARDFADLEFILDGFGKDPYDVLLTIRGAKEATSPIVGKSYVYHISQGVKILNFREVEKCPDCRGQGYKMGKECGRCEGRKFTDK